MAERLEFSAVSCVLNAVLAETTRGFKRMRQKKGERQLESSDNEKWSAIFESFVFGL